MIDKQQLTRKKLYDLVWEKPITHLAKEFDTPAWAYGYADQIDPLTMFSRSLIFDIVDVRRSESDNLKAEKQQIINCGSNSISSNLVQNYPGNFKSINMDNICEMNTAQQKTLEHILESIAQTKKYTVISINKNEDNTIAVRIRKES